jgi:type I restriction enzyme S subunit
MCSNAQHISLGELVELRTERAVRQKDPDLPYVGLEHIAQGEPFLLSTAPGTTSVSTNSVFEPSDILFGKLRPNLRKSLQVQFRGYCSTDILVLRAREGIHPGFAAKVFQSGAVFDAAIRTAIGTKMPRTSWEHLKTFCVFVPSLPEQRRIAEILDAADEAIRQTERVIAKLKAIKAGLLHDLLTRGLDKYGHLRDPQARPEQFKDSPLGRIPKEWEVRQLGDLAHNKGDYGSGAAALEYDSDLPRYVRITDITDDGYLDPDSRASIHRSDAEGCYLQRGDLVFARSGATVGKTYLYDEADGECAYAGYVIKFSLDFDLCDSRFVFYWTQSEFYWAWVNQTLRQGAQPNINAQEYRQLELAYPPLGEQCRIVAALDPHDVRTRAEEAVLEKLRQVKRGLMDDLLTGRVRVTP